MSITLLLNSEDLAPEQIQALTTQLCSELNNETEMEAKLSEPTSQIGAKGDPITIGTILLTFLTSGAAVGLFQVLRSYFERKSSLQIELRRQDGTKLVIRAENLKPDQIDESLTMTQGFFGRSK